MSDMPTPQLDEQLGELTAWRGPTPELWRRALAATASRRKWGFPSIFRSQASLCIAVGAAAAAIFITVGVFTHRGRSNGEQSADVTDSPPGPATVRPSTEDLEGARYYSVASSPEKAQTVDDIARMRNSILADRDDATRRGGRPRAGGGASPPASPATPPPSSGGERGAEPSGERQVIRKATIELVTKDVRATFLKATQLISEARGEYVQDSGLTGEPNRMEGNLTLRVAAERLPEMLNELRGLGEVRAEKSGGEDVTTQVVDLEARLRNEQRVEAEMLQLLEKRQDAPLKEILELRSALSGVRQTIEQLTGQRERLGRLVSLATVLVIIRPADAPAQPPPPAPGLGAYFLRVFDEAWRDGLMFLMNTLLALLSIFIGGLIWWVLLLIAILWVRAYRRRRRAAVGGNPISR